MKRSLPAAALLAVLAAGTVGCQAEKHEDPCPPGQVFCAGCREPASFQTDASNCGACGVACGHGTCVGGVCQCEGWTSCPGQNPRCKDTQSDPAHCGTCGLACGHGTCAGGVCQCEGWVSCPGANPRCKDVQNDPANCGTDVTACGNACPLTNDVCVAGACQCPVSLPDTCPAGTPTRCVNLANDANDCGACGNACTKTNEVCATRSCTCPAALPHTCGTACVNRATDEQNCGTCGFQCATGATCASGSCECPSAQSVCGTACVDRETDEQNCGTCGSVCPATATCTTGTCRCPAGPQAGCDNACCSGGTACCGSACQTQHTNGLGGSKGGAFFDCNPLYAPSATTKAAALAAANAWEDGLATYDGIVCDPFCIARQTAGSCAVWCYAGSPIAGRAKAVGSTVCSSACPYDATGFSLWQ